MILGIDPGFDGALALLDHNGACFGIADTPTTFLRRKPQRREYNLPEIRQLLYYYQDLYKPLRAALESTHAMPKQGVRSMFQMGLGLGMWMGMLAGLAIPYELIPPQRWKKVMLDGMPKGKLTALVKARQLWPSAELGLKKHVGRADALLLAEYLRRVSVVQP